MPIGVVIFTYNRWSNLRLVLRSLKEQTLPLSEFHVIVADDGSTDETLDELLRLTHSTEWKGRLHFVSGGPHHGARITRINNIGIANVPLECSFFVALDSDMCLAPDALEQFSKLHSQYPQAVIITRLDWLPPMTHAQIETIWDEQGFDGLCAVVPQHPMKWVEHTLVGTEIRALRPTPMLEPLDSDPFHPVYGLPTELYWRASGFDEDMVGYGWQALEFAIRLQQLGVSMVTTMEIRSLHIWHPKDPEITDLVPAQRQKNTAYVLRKHGSQPNPMRYRNWTYWRHYHKAHDGAVVYVVEQLSGLYVVDETRTHCLRLPHAGWLYPLGFSTEDVEFVKTDAVLSLAHMGEAQDPLNECDLTILIDDLETALAKRMKTWRQDHSGLSSNNPLPDLHSTRQISLQHLFMEYDIIRTRADTLPGASLPILGFIIRMLARIMLAGKVWAAERNLLEEIIATLGEIDGKTQ